MVRWKLRRHFWKNAWAITFAAGMAAIVFSAPETPTLLLTSGRFWTGDAKRPWAQAVAIVGGRIIAVGGTAEISKLADAQTQRRDLGGAFAMPGFNDAHIHFHSGAERLFQVDLNSARSLEEMQQRVAKFAQENPAQGGGDPWIRGFGWQYSFMPEKRLPTRQDLDAVVADRPVFLSAYDGHTGWANSKALELAGVNKNTQFSGFGEIVRDAAGQPTGVLKEGAQGLITRAIPPASREHRLNALRRALRLAASLGMTSIQNAHGSPADVELYQELLDKGELTLRVSVAQTIRPGITQAQMDEIAALAKKYNGPMLRVGSVKIVMDGVIETHTAAMLEPYADKDSLGTPAWTREQLNDAVRMADRASLQVYIHAIGDRGVRMALDAFENARKVNGPRDHRHRVEHIETVAAADIPRFRQLGVLASMMPIHADPETIEVWANAVGKTRLPRSFAWRSLEQAGAHLVFSSDWPSAIDINPIHGLHTAVNRMTTAGQPKGGWLPEQRISLEHALRAYTQAGAYSSFEETSKGILAAGMAADIIVLSHDPFKIPARETHSIRVQRTFLGGREVFAANQ
jgi:hypothetical protein